MFEIERSSTRSHSVENLLRKELWTFRKADYVENDLFWAWSSLTMSKTPKYVA